MYIHVNVHVYTCTRVYMYMNAENESCINSGEFCECNIATHVTFCMTVYLYTVCCDCNIHVTCIHTCSRVACIVPNLQSCVPHCPSKSSSWLCLLVAGADLTSHLHCQTTAANSSAEGAQDSWTCNALRVV